MVSMPSPLPSVYAGGTFSVLHRSLLINILCVILYYCSYIFVAILGPESDLHNLKINEEFWAVFHWHLLEYLFIYKNMF